MSKVDVPDCFVAGTMIATEEGHLPIEDIKIGDHVWATDPETGVTDLKKVVNTFINETTAVTHVTINGEVITSTQTHPYYVVGQGWTLAGNLRAGDILVMLNGEKVVLELVQHEILETPVTTYNFEVADFHTYYVGTSNLLVHNKCIFDELGINNFVEVGSKYTPDGLINKLDELGFSKSTSFQSSRSGISTFMSSDNLTFRIQANPENGIPYFRVMNNKGNYLGPCADILSNTTKKEFRRLTHFYFN